MVIRVLLVDDEPLVRSGLRAILGSEEDLEVVGEATDGTGVTALARRLRPDVVVMDVRMPGIDGIEATRRLLAGVDPPPAVLVVTTFEHDDHVLDALRAGASGFLLKRAAPERIVEAVRTLAAGDALLFPEALRRLVAGAPAPLAPDRLADARLTRREGEVLRLVARGWSNAEIAAELVVGDETVKTHVAAILGKLGVRDRTQAVVRAYESGFVAVGGD